MDIKAHMKVKLDRLDYDFGHFTLEGFVRWLEEQRGRKILFIPWSLGAGISGAWISDADEPFEYVFYDAAAVGLHQAHIKLHELAHMICGHPTLRLGYREIKALLQGRLSESACLDPVLLRSTHSTEMGMEAETLAALIQERALRFSALEELTAGVSSDEDIAEYMRAMELV